MTIYVFDSADDLPANPGTNARIELADAGTTIVETGVTATGAALQAANKQRILIGANGSIDASLFALKLEGADSGVTNEGTIESETATAIQFSGGGTSTVTNASGKTITGAKGIEIASAATSARLELLNAGTVTATVAANAAVIGGLGADRVVNTGAINASTAAGISLDLKGGDDLYDGRNGTVTGAIKLGLGDDIAYGGSGNETFFGEAGSNVIYAGVGDDTIMGGDGYNTVNGGGGIGDTIDYSAATSSQNSPGVTVNLGSGTGYGNGFLDTLSGIENVIGSNHNDTITGDGGDNTLKGGNGDDTLEGGFGNDRIEGGGGNNTAKYSSSTTTAAKVNLSLTAAQDTGYGTDTLIGIRNLEGGFGADEFTGNEENNRLVGNSGSDKLSGGIGNDTLEGGAGDDRLEGGAGDDRLEGGTGKNTAVFSGNYDDYTVVTNGDGTITVTDSQGGRDGTDTLKDVRFAEFAGRTVALTNGAPSNVSPSISPTNVSESRAVGSQVTTLFSSDPDGDTLTFSLVNDAGGLFTLDGNKLMLARALDYETATQHTITVKVSDGWGGEFVKELTINVTNSTTETNPLVKQGTNGSEQVVGENGNDRLYGLAGNDEIFGQGGDDMLWGGTGKDTYIGGAGRDVFVFDTKPNVKTNLDWIYDFNVNDDTIHLSKKAFSKLARKGALSKDAFVVGDRVKDAEDRIIYHKKGGALFYDPDGTGLAKAVQIATIGKNLAITHKDFYVI